MHIMTSSRERIPLKLLKISHPNPDWLSVDNNSTRGRWSHMQARVVQSQHEPPSLLIYAMRISHQPQQMTMINIRHLDSDPKFTSRVDITYPSGFQPLDPLADVTSALNLMRRAVQVSLQERFFQTFASNSWEVGHDPFYRAQNILYHKPYTTITNFQR